MKKIFIINVIFIILLFFNSSKAEDFWLRTNGPYGAKISRINIDTSNDDIYLATKSDGVYRSTNYGQSWLSMDEAKTNDPNKMCIHTSVNDLIVGPNSTLYVATDSSGIFKKMKNQSWVKRAINNNPVIYCIYMLNGGSLLAGTNTSIILRSTNDANSWEYITNGLTSVTHIYAITQSNNNTIFIGTDVGIYKSTDGGQNWTVSNNLGGSTKVNFFAKSADGNIIMAGTSKGVYATSNNGTLWNPQNSGMPANTNVISLAYNPKDSFFIAGTESLGFYYSHISTMIWFAYNTGLESMKIRAVATNAQGELYAGTNFAFYKSPDNKSGFTAYNSGLGLRTVNRFAPIAEKADILAATDLGIYRTTNSGTNWTQLNQGLGDYLDVAALVVARTGDYFAGTKGDGLYTSTNQGNSWAKLAGFSPTEVTTLDTSTSGLLWAGTRSQGVQKSNDITGKTWAQMTGGIENKEILSFVGQLNDYVYAGTNGDGLWRKAPFESDFQKVNQTLFGISSTIVYALAFRDTGITDIEGTIFAATNYKIRRSNNNSTSWFEGSGVLPGSALAVTACENGWLLAGIKNLTSVYIDSTIKNGDNWTVIYSNSGINNYETQTMSVSGRGYIFAGTKGGGCYRSKESTSGRILRVFTNQSDTIQLQQGDKIDFSIDIYDGGDNEVSGVTIVDTNDLGLTIPDLTTNASGNATTQVTIPPNLPDGWYTIKFVASRIGYLESEVKIVYLDVQRQKVFIDEYTTPIDTQYRDWEQDYQYDIIAKNKDKAILPDMTIHVIDQLNGNKTLTTDSEGKAVYTATVPDSSVEQLYTIKFVAEDPTAYYFPSDTAKRILIVDHNDIPICCDKKVCINGIYLYYTATDTTKSYTWKNLVGGTFQTGTNRDTVQIRWIASGKGEFTLEQKINKTGVITSRTYIVDVFDLPVVTLNDFADTVCPNVPYDLSQVTVNPPGGVFSGPGVNNGWFYGDSAGGQGSYPITYTYTSDVEPYCVNSATKNIYVYALPNVTLNMPKTTVCLSDFPYQLTGGNWGTGTYSGKGVSNNIFDPAVAGVGTHEITFTYTDENTGCTNTAKQNLKVDTAATTSFIIPNTTICESTIALKLKPFIQDLGSFSGPGVDMSDTTFDAQAAGIGTHRIVFTTDSKIGNCPAVAFVDVTVVGVPPAPTISFGPSQTDTSWLESSEPKGNTWYRYGQMIDVADGRNNQRITPRDGGDYTVTFTDTSAPFCESFHSAPFPFKVTAASGTMTPVPSETGAIAPGKKFTIGIKMGDPKDIMAKDIYKITADLIYNASLLYPTGNTQKGTIDIVKKTRTIPLTINVDPNNVKSGDNILTLEFQATVGNEESTDLRFDNVHSWAQNGDSITSNIGIASIKITINVNKRSGTSRLYDSWGESFGLLFSSIIPNPANESFQLDYSIAKDSWINIYIMDVNGHILKKIYEGEAKADENSELIDASDLNTGVYYLILQTTFQKEAKQLQIIK